MTRSRIFLGLTTGALAIAGAVAVKANNFGSTNGFYITTNGFCTPHQSPCQIANGTKTCLTLSGTGAKYFTSKTTVNQVKCNTARPLKYING